MAKKHEEFQDLMRDLADLVGSYSHLPPDRLQAFALRADISLQGAHAERIRVRGGDVLTAGDSMTLWIVRRA